MKFTDQLISIICQQRHLATRVIIATQEPTLSPRLLDLCNVTIVHRFLSPAWFAILRGHLAGAGHGKGKDCNDVAELFRTIVGLKTGEALLFCPTAMLDVGKSEPDRLFSHQVIKELKDAYIRIRIRKRLTADGGKSIMASDKAAAVEEPAAPPPALIPLIPNTKISTRALRSRLDGTHQGVKRASVSAHTLVPKSPTEDPILQQPALSKTAGNTADSTNQTSGSGRTIRPVPSAAQREEALRAQVLRALKTATVKPHDIDFGAVRNAAAVSLGLNKKIYRRGNAAKSKAIIRDEIVGPQANAQLPVAPTILTLLFV